jgi:hypothetical protein
VETGFGLLAAGVLLFGGYAVDAVWVARNQGVRGVSSRMNARLGDVYHRFTLCSTAAV